jgi:hypothetical protein
MSVTDATAPVFRPAVVLWMIVVGVVAFAGFIVLLAYAPDLRSEGGGGGGQAHALSRSAVGYAGIVKLLGEDAEVSRGRAADEAGLLVLTPDANDTGEDVNALRGDAQVLVVVEKWTYGDDQRRPGWVRRTGVDPLALYQALLGEVAGRITMRRDPRPADVTLRGVSAPWVGRTWKAGRVEHLTTIGGPDAFPLIVDGQGRAILAQVGGKNDETQTYVLSDPDLLNNLGMASVERATFANSLLRGLRSGSAPIVFDVTLNGFERGRSLLKLALEPPFLAATLCVLAAALLTGLHAAARFGPARRPERAVALGKRALADNAAGLIRLAKREPRMAPRYAQLVREQVARAVGAPRDLGPEQQGAFLDRLTAGAVAGPTLTELTEAAAAVRDPAALMRSAQALHRWRTEMTRGR